MSIGGKKRASDRLELESRRLCTASCGRWRLNSGSLQEQRPHSSLSHLSSPEKISFASAIVVWYFSRMFEFFNLLFEAASHTIALTLGWNSLDSPGWT